MDMLEGCKMQKLVLRSVKPLSFRPSHWIMCKKIIQWERASHLSLHLHALGTSNPDRKVVRLHSVFVLDDPCSEDIHSLYHFGQELGRGQFGITRKCIDLKTGLPMACKSIEKSKLRPEIDVENVRREVEIMRRLPHHPNIVRFKEAYEDKSAIHLVMELCNGGSLFDRIVARDCYTERAAAIITKTIVEVVKLCHEHGVMHRDLKPENFLFADPSEESPLKAIDFGLSVIFKPGERFRAIFGSSYYMAPEVLQCDYGPQVDIWSAGVILYILLFGVYPFWAETNDGIAEAIVHSSVNYRLGLWPNVSQEAKDLVRRMLDRNPYTRLKAEDVLEHYWIQNANLAPDIPLGENVRARIKQFMFMNKFKKRVLRIVADSLPNEQVAGIKKLFHEMDTDKNGNLSFDELKHGLHHFGHPVPDSDVQMWMDAADVDGSGTLNCEEFVTMWLHIKRIGSEEHLAQAFHFFDRDHNGYIEFDELRQVLSDENPASANEKMIHDIILDADSDKDGKISFEEFQEMMRAVGVDRRLSSRAMLHSLS